MRKILTALLATALCLVVNAQMFDPDRPMIIPFEVCADSINAQMHDNLNKPPHYKLTDIYGWVQIPNTFYQHNGKSMGIILVQTSSYAYIAFDARCPRCFYDDEITDSKIKMYSSLSAICQACGAEAQGLVNVGASSMTRYNHKTQAPAQMNTYLVKEIKKGKETHLRIYNAYNGVWDEWKDLPENKFLIGKDIF